MKDKHLPSTRCVTAGMSVARQLAPQLHGPSVRTRTSRRRAAALRPAAMGANADGAADKPIKARCSLLLRGNHAKRASRIDAGASSGDSFLQPSGANLAPVCPPCTSCSSLRGSCIRSTASRTRTARCLTRCTRRPRSTSQMPQTLAGTEPRQPIGDRPPCVCCGRNMRVTSSAVPRRFDYTRSGNPTRLLLEEQMAELEVRRSSGTHPPLHGSRANPAAGISPSSHFARPSQLAPLHHSHPGGCGPSLSARGHSNSQRS